MLASFIGINATHIYCLFEILPDYRKFVWSGETPETVKYSSQYAVIYGGHHDKKLNLQIRTCDRHGYVDGHLASIINAKKHEYSEIELCQLKAVYPDLYKQVTNHLTVAKLTCQ